MVGEVGEDFPYPTFWRDGNQGFEGMETKDLKGWKPRICEFFLQDIPMP